MPTKFGSIPAIVQPMVESASGRTKIRRSLYEIAPMAGDLRYWGSNECNWRSTRIRIPYAVYVRVDDIQREVLTGESSDASQGIRLTAPSQFIQTPLHKIEEVAVRMPTEGIVALVASLLTQLSQIQAPFGLNQDQKQRIQDSYAVFQRS